VQVSEVDSQYRRRIQAAQVHSYFYGGPPYSHGALSPHSMSIKFEFLKIYRFGEGNGPFFSDPIVADQAVTGRQSSMRLAQRCPSGLLPSSATRSWWRLTQAFLDRVRCS
jgi:hypothetical protein